MGQEFIDFVDTAIRILVPVGTALAAFFWAEVKDVRQENAKLRAEISQNNEERQKEIAKVREEFVSLETLRATEERITHYFDRRLGDMVEKLGSRLDMVVQLMKRDN